MKITLEISEENEATAFPYWMIIDPRQNFNTNEQGVHNIASMITGPFFSRNEAASVLVTQRHHFSLSAKVYCCSSHRTIQYRNAIEQVSYVKK